MPKLVFTWFYIFLAAASANGVGPRDLSDDALQQIEELNSIVQGQIFTAHDDLANQMTEFNTNSANVGQNGQIALQQEHEGIDVQLNSIKDLADAVNADISPCTDVREGVLIRLPTLFAQSITSCLNGINQEASAVSADARYTVDIVINKVNQLDYQVRQCRGDLLCISPLMTEIQLDKIRLPQNIKTEVQAFESLLALFKLSVQSCADDNVADYSSQAYTLLNEITACVNRVIG